MPPRTHTFAGPGAYHVNGRLTNFSLRYEMGGMIARKVLKTVPVVNETDEFTTWDKLHVVTGSDGPRGHREAATEVRYGQSSDTYRLRFYSHSGFVSNRERDNADDYVGDPDERCVRNVKEILMVQEEIRAANLLFTAGNYGASNKVTLSGSDQFSNPTSDPVSVFLTAFNTVRRNSRLPREMMSVVMGDNVYETLCEHPNIVSKFVYAQGGVIAKAQLAQFLRINPDNLHVGVSSYNSANEGQADAETAIWGNKILVGYIHPKPDLDTLTLAVTFRREEDEQVWDVESGNPRGTEHVVELAYDQKMIASGVGYLISDAIAA